MDGISLGGCEGLGDDDVRAGGAIWLNPFATVLFSVCSAVTVECFVPVLHGCVWYVCCYVRKKALLQCLQLLTGYGPV